MSKVLNCPKKAATTILHGNVPTENKATITKLKRKLSFRDQEWNAKDKNYDENSGRTKREGY